MSLAFYFFFLFPLWAAFDLKSFLSWLRCWSGDQGLAEGSCWLAPGRTFGPNPAHVLSSCLFKIHLMLSSPWKLSLREVLDWFIFSLVVIPSFSCVDLSWQRDAGWQLRVPVQRGDQDNPTTTSSQLRVHIINIGFVSANHLICIWKIIPHSTGLGLKLHVSQA